MHHRRAYLPLLLSILDITNILQVSAAPPMATTPSHPLWCLSTTNIQALRFLQVRHRHPLLSPWFAFLCSPGDSKVHAANKLASRHPGVSLLVSLARWASPRFSLPSLQSWYALLQPPRLLPQALPCHSLLPLHRRR